MNYAIIISILAVITAAAILRNNKAPKNIELKPLDESEPIRELFSIPIRRSGRYELILPKNKTFITNPMSGLSPDYTLDEFRTIFTRFLNVVEQYNSFSEILRKREDEEMEDLPPINILNVQFEIVLPRCDHMSIFNSNRVIATLNFISAQLGLTQEIINDSDIKRIVDRLKVGFQHDPMTAVPIHGD